MLLTPRQFCLGPRHSRRISTLYLKSYHHLSVFCSFSARVLKSTVSFHPIHLSLTMTSRTNVQSISAPELAQMAHAFKLYIETRDHCSLSDEAIGSIIGLLQGGLGTIATSRNMVSTLQRSQPTLYAAVTNDPAYWSSRAHIAYHRWMDMTSPIIQS